MNINPEAPPPDLAGARRDLAAARRRLRSLTAQLSATGGADLFAGDPASLTVRAEAAQAQVTELENCVAQLRPGRAQLRLVGAAPAAAVPNAEPVEVAETVVAAAGPTAAANVEETTAKVAAPLPEVAPLLRQLRELEAVVHDPARPLGVAPVRTAVEQELAEAVERADRLRSSRAMLPEGCRQELDDAIRTTEQHWLEFREQRRTLESPDHPAALAQQRWDARHPNVDARLAATRSELDAAVTTWADGPGRDYLPQLPVNVSEEGRQLWLDAAASQLAYRETYQVDAAEPLGPRPWDPRQVELWEEARAKLATVGVDAVPAVERTADVDTSHELGPSRDLVSNGGRRSLRAVLSAVG
jgi:hypothetical protein